VSEDPAHRSYWRVGHTGEPLGFVPLEICEYSHRFDDLHHRFRTVYIAELAETSLRETLADFRPKLSAIQHFQQEMGASAAQELPAWPITAAWRREHVLAPLLLKLHGPIYDLTDIAQRQSIEERRSALLLEHDMQHLDLHEITTSRRVVTQTIAGDLYDDGMAAIRFPSQLDGNPCIAVFEGHGDLHLDGAIVPLTDPPPQQLLDVAAGWHLTLQPSPSIASEPD
jgi:RES domain-containing protein